MMKLSSKTDFYSLPPEIVTDSVSPNLAIRDRFRLGTSHKKLKEDPNYWGRLAKDLGLQATAEPLSYPQISAKISDVYKKFARIDDINTGISKKYRITNFQKNLRIIYDHIANLALRFPNEPIALSAEQKGALYAATVQRCCHMADAIRNGLVDHVEALIQAGARPNEYLLDIAIRQKNLPCVALLLQKISPDSYHLALAEGLKNGEEEHDANVQSIYEALLMVATERPLPKEEHARRAPSIRFALRHRGRVWESSNCVTRHELFIQLYAIANFRNSAEAIGALRGFFLKNYERIPARFVPFFLMVLKSPEILEAFFLAGYRPDSSANMVQYSEHQTFHPSAFSCNTLIVALESGDRKIIEPVLDADAQAKDLSDECIENTLACMLHDNTTQWIESVLPSGFSFTGLQLLNACIRVQDVEKVLLLLQQGVNPTFDTLFKAVRTKNVRILTAIVGVIRSRRIPFDLPKVYFLGAFQVYPGESDKVIKLMEAAVNSRNPHILRLILQLYVDVWKLKMKHLLTILNLAIATKDSEIVRIVVDAGARPQCEDAVNFDRDSVVRAVYTEDVQIVEHVMRAGGKAPTKGTITYNDAVEFLIDQIIAAEVPASPYILEIAKATQKPTIIKKINDHNRSLELIAIS